jgi:hypothetical protein
MVGRYLLTGIALRADSFKAASEEHRSGRPDHGSVLTIEKPHRLDMLLKTLAF